MNRHLSDQATEVPGEHARGSAAENDVAMKAISSSLRDLRFGSVTIIVQDGVIVQIDRTEKNRLRFGAAQDRSA